MTTHDSPPGAAAETPMFELSSQGVQARAEVRGRQLVVLAGSTARASQVPSLTDHSYAALRTNLLSSGQLVDEGTGTLRFAVDVPFNSPSAAAATVLGRTANGRLEWKLAGQPHLSYGDWQSQAGNAGPEDDFPAGPATTWKPFFRELATRVLDYEGRQAELVQVLRDAGIKVGDDEGAPLTELDPFSFFSLVLKYNTDASALSYFAKVGAALGVEAAVPTDLTGVPWSNPMKPRFFDYPSKRQPGDVATLWQLARQATAGDLDAKTFEAALKIRQVGLAKLTQGLFWLNPGRYLPLNGINAPYLERRGVAQAGQVQTLAEYEAVLSSARKLNPDFSALSHAAWVNNRAATLEAGHFPYARFQADVHEYGGDRAKGNIALDNRYAPLLLELMSGAWSALKPARSPYSGSEQLAVKVGLGGAAQAQGGVFARALLFGEGGGTDADPFPAGLTLEAGLTDGKDDGPRQRLEYQEILDRLLTVLNAALPVTLGASLNLDREFGSAEPVLLGPGRAPEAEALLTRYRHGEGMSRRFRLGLTLTPEQLMSDAFTELLGAALSYINGVLEELERLSAAPSKPILPPAELSGAPAPDPGAEPFKAPPGVKLNRILYGPPGTGKTYRVVDEALAVLDPAFLDAHSQTADRPARKARYDELIAEGRISFVTFHQSFGYEDFIEGLRPVMAGGQLTYRLTDGVLLEAVRKAGGDLAPAEPDDPEGAASQAAPVPPLTPTVHPEAQVWRMYIDGTSPVSTVRELSLARGELRIGSWLGGSLTLDGRPPAPLHQPVNLEALPEDQLNAQQHAFKDSLRRGDVVLLATGKDSIGAVGVVEGEYTFDPSSECVFATDFAHARKVKWLAKGLTATASEVLGKVFTPQTIQRVAGVRAEDVLKALNVATEAPTAPVPASQARPAPSLRAHVLVIDEINRGNISKIFGELITLIEPSKRAGAAEALSVTLPLSRRKLTLPPSLYMIGTMNTADRSLTLLDAALRRRFALEEILPDPEVLGTVTLSGTTVDLRKFLAAINARLERLLGRDHMIGHAYLLPVPTTLAELAAAVRERIIPLLEEYFFEDRSKIHEVLGDAGKAREAQFFQKTGQGDQVSYRPNQDAFDSIEAFTGVYAGVADADFPFKA